MPYSECVRMTAFCILRTIFVPGCDGANKSHLLKHSFNFDLCHTSCATFIQLEFVAEDDDTNIEFVVDEGFSLAVLIVHCLCFLALLMQSVGSID